ncbi:hypothetical protein HCH52_06095 [Oscillospiraceae bacterium HV4-5-C5C]|nr:hypothetical protein [Oscillospiraceae bacterium HV4-5-C5C]
MMHIQRNYSRQVAGWQKVSFGLGCTGILAVCLLLSHYNILQGDDFLHMAIGGQAHGRFTAADWLQSWHDDYFYTNGRMADALLRLVLRPGVPAARLIIGLTLAALIAALYNLSRLSSPGLYQEAPGPSTAWAMICFGAFSLLLYSHPYIYADCIGWFSGAVNYLLPSSLILLGLLPSFYWSAGLKPPAAVLIISTLCLITGQLAHEQTDLAVLFYFITLLLYSSLKRRYLTKGQYAQILLSLLISGFHFSAPGIRRRLSSLPVSSGDQPLIRLWMRTADSSQEFVWVLRWGLILLALVLLLLIWRPARRSQAVCQRSVQSLLLLFLTAANITLMYLRRSWGLHVLTAGLPEGSGLSSLSWPRLFIAVQSSLGLIALAAIVLAILLSDPEAQVQRQITVLAALIGAAGIPLALGSQNVRSYFTSGIFLSLFYLSLLQSCLTDDLTTRPASRLKSSRQPAASPVRLRSDLFRKAAVILVTTLVLVSSLQVFRTTVYRARQNAQVWSEIENKLTASGDNLPAGIAMLNVADFPYPDDLYFMAYDQGRYEAAIRLYYAVPASCQLSWPAA